MGWGIGLSAGIKIEKLVAYRPTDRAYVDHTGAVYHPQDDGGAGNVPHYEIQNTSDEIELDLRAFTEELESPTCVFYTGWGPTDFDVIDVASGDTVISEQSGFDATGWTVGLSDVEGGLRLTDFDTADGVDGTQAGWFPFVGLYDRVE